MYAKLTKKLNYRKKTHIQTQIMFLPSTGLYIYILYLHIINMLPEAVICMFRGAYLELIITLLFPACCAVSPGVVA